MFVATLVATWYGGIFGVTAIAFEKGIYNFITQGIFWYLTYILFALFFVSKARSFDALTLPELIGKMFGPMSAKISAVFNFFNVVPVVYAISLGLFLKTIFGGSVELMTSIGIVFVVAYSIKGGFRSIVFSDAVQFFVMCTAVALIFIYSVTTFGGIDFLKQNLPENHFSPSGGESLWTVFAWGMIALSTLVDPNFYQRCFAAKSEQVAKKGILISTLVWVFFDICTTAGAMYAAAVIPEADSKTAYLTYAIQLLPHGLRGFVLAGILATILSTIDSYIFTASTTLSYDLGPKKLAKSQKMHQVYIVLVGILSVVMASLFDGNIKLIWKTLGSYSAACLLFPVMVGYWFPKQISDRSFVAAVFVGVVATTYWKVIDHSGYWQNIDEIYAGVLGTSLILLMQIFRTGLRKQEAGSNNK
jgi:SSS family solute:Na+ symporter